MIGDRVVGTIFVSPIGNLRLTSDGKALTGLDLETSQGGPEGDEQRLDDTVLKSVREQLSAYFEGEREHFDLPLDLRGTEFQRRAWDALRAIPFGETVSYAELACCIGAPRAVRAVGAAMGRNPIPII